MSKQRTKILLGAIAIIVFVALAAFVRERFLAARVVLTGVHNDATVYVNGDPRRAYNDNGTVTLSLPIGSQEIGVDQEGYWPWVKTVSLDSGSTYTFTTFSVPRALDAEGIRTSHPDYTAIQSALDAAQVPTPTNPAVSYDGNAEIWLDGEEIILGWVGTSSETPVFMCEPGCEQTHVVTNVVTAIRSLSFYPGRNDLLVLATLDGVFALEADTRGIQNFQRLYKGDDPVSVIYENGLYIREGQRLVKVRTN